MTIVEQAIKDGRGATHKTTLFMGCCGAAPRYAQVYRLRAEMPHEVQELFRILQEAHEVLRFNMWADPNATCAEVFVYSYDLEQMRAACREAARECEADDMMAATVQPPGSFTGERACAQTERAP